MKWLLRITVLALGLDLSAGLFGLFVGMRAGGLGTVSQADYWSPLRVGVSLGALVAVVLWSWVAVRVVRSPWNAHVPLLIYIALRLSVTALLWRDLSDEGVKGLLHLNAFPLVALLVAIVALLKPVPEPDASPS